MRPTAPRAFESKQHSTRRRHFEALLGDGGSGHVAAQSLQASAVPGPDCGADVHVDPADLREALVRRAQLAHRMHELARPLTWLCAQKLPMLSDAP